MFLVQRVMPYISGLYTLPWIIVGFLSIAIIRTESNQDKIDRALKNVGIIILYFFIPVLVFRIFLDTALGVEELRFVLFISVAIIFMYALAYFYAKYQIRKQKLSGEDEIIYFKTVFTNQGRSSAFVGGAMLAIESWRVPAAIVMALVGLTLFAIVPYILNHMNQKEQRGKEIPVSLPWFLRIYPYYFILYVVSAIFLQKTTGINTGDLGNFGILLRFYASITIPIALFYVGSGMHPNDLKLSELKKLIGLVKGEKAQHWLWVRQIFLLTAVFTPAIFAIILTTLFSLSLIPAAWFSVTLINAVLPITSTNMFLVPYGLDKKATAHSVTWSTIFCVPLTVILIGIFSIYFG
jgi:hypothetical protein